ncbi:MAG: PAS domain S-box protein [Polyangiaceae bacterium]
MNRSFLAGKSASGIEPASTLSKIALLEERATRAEATLLQVLDSSHAATIIHRKSIVEYVNPALCELTGYAPEDLIGKNGVSILLHPDEIPALTEIQRRSEAGEQVLPSRARWQKKDGSIIWTEGVRTIIDYQGEPAVIVRARDISREMEIVSDRDRAEQTLRVTDERFRVLFERSPIPVWIWDVESLDVLAANEAAMALYGYSREEFSRLKLSDMRAPAEIPALTDNIAVARAQTHWRGVTTHCKKSGTPFRLEVTAHMISLDGHAAMLSMGRDLSDVEQMENQLRQSQKMDAVGQLAGGIAHDFNNILAVIVAVADMMLLDLEAGHPFIDDLHEIEAAARRASTLTHQLLTFSRQQPARPKNILLSSVVSQMEKMLVRTVRENVEMKLDLSATGVIYADPTLLEQVLLNLVVNARDAMPDGGTLLIETANVVLGESEAAAMNVEPGKYQELSVTDTGSGMSPDVQARIFDPFFTTKEIGKGTGLGLSTVFGIVIQSCGAITVDSAPGRGTTFKIALPQACVSPDSLPARPQMCASKAGSETILLVEDEESVRRVVSRMLRSNGYKVIEAAGGREALALIQGGDAIHLMVTDLMMPDMNGHALGREIAAKFPYIKLLYMSGHDLDASKQSGTPVADEAFISKPFTPSAMLSAIRGLLERAP